MWDSCKCPTVASYVTIIYIVHISFLFYIMPTDCVLFFYIMFLQRHFCVFALSFPGADALSTIYSTILTQHLKWGNFSAALQKSSQQLIHLALALHLKIAATFLPTAIKFHYNFNLRDFSNVFQVGCCLFGELLVFIILTVYLLKEARFCN